jgi:hypothetical protein
MSNENRPEEPEDTRDVLALKVEINVPVPHTKEDLDKIFASLRDQVEGFTTAYLAGQVVKKARYGGEGQQARDA